jgi:hypothetical protein
MIGGLLKAAVGAARGSHLGREDRRRRELEDAEADRREQMGLLQMAEMASRTRQRDELLGANVDAYERHRAKHPDELSDYNPGIDYGRLELDEADEARRTDVARAERSRAQQERIDALVAAGVSPAVARARVVADYDPEAVASARASRDLMNESRQQTIADRARRAVVESAAGTADKLAAEGGTIPGVQSALEQLYRGKLDAGTLAGIAARAVSTVAQSKRRSSALTLPGGVSIDAATPAPPTSGGTGPVDLGTSPSSALISDAEIDAMLLRGMSPDEIAAEAERRAKAGRKP